MRKILISTLLIATAATAVFAQASKPAKPTPKAAAKPAAKQAVKPVVKKVDQAAVLEKYWKMPDTTVVGTINGIKITKAELMKKLWEWNAPATLSELMQQKATAIEAKKEKLIINKTALESTKMNILKQYEITDYNDFYAKMNVTPSRFNDSVISYYQMESMAAKNAKVTDAELDTYVKVSHILIKFNKEGDPEINSNTTPEMIEAAKTKIDEIYAKVKAGEDFATLAKENSEDSSKADGGNLGWINKDTGFVEPFKSIALKMKAGEVSEPFRTVYGYHIIKCTATGKTASAQERSELRSRAITPKMALAKQALSELMSKQYKLNNYLALPKPAPVELPRTPAMRVPPSPARTPQTTPEAKPETNQQTPSDATAQPTPETKPDANQPSAEPQPPPAPVNESDLETPPPPPQ